MRASAGLIGILTVLAASAARADVLHLRTGYSQECVVLKETDTHIYYLVPEGQAGLPLYKVVGITYESEEQNKRLMKQWQAERAAAEAKRRAQERRQTVERLQKEALGLVEYEGEWIPKDEAVARAQQRREAKDAAAQLDKLEQAADHTFYNHIWMTQETYDAVRDHEQILLKHQTDVEDRQNEMSMIDNQITVLQRQMIEAGGLEGAEELSKRVDELKKNQDTAREEMQKIIAAGDEQADKILDLEETERTRLKEIVSQHGWPPQTMDFLGNSL